jgi:hypothetical protein
VSNDNAVTITSGQTVRFPVTSDHPLAQFQQLKAVSDMPNISDLAIARQLTAMRPGLTTAELSDAVNSYLNASGAASIAALQFPDFIVEAGATVVFAGPITTVDTNIFYVDGELIAHGSLNVTCNTFGAAPESGDGGGGGGGGSTGGTHRGPVEQ